MSLTKLVLQARMRGARVLPLDDAPQVPSLLSTLDTELRFRV